MYARLQDLPGLMDEDGLKEGLRSVAIIPVIHQDRVIASINVASHQYEEVPATARAALETLAAQVGSAIARVQAEEALCRAKDGPGNPGGGTHRPIAAGQRVAGSRTSGPPRDGTNPAPKRNQISHSGGTNPGHHLHHLPRRTSDLPYVSPQIETLLGFSPEAWRADAENWEKQIHPEDRSGCWRRSPIVWKRVSRSPPNTACWQNPGGSVWFRDEARVVHDPEGQFLFLQGLALDITERKQAEEALQQTTQTLQTLIEASPLAIITLNPDFKISLWNPGAERMFGWTESEVLGDISRSFRKTKRIEEEVRLKQEMGERRNPPWNLSVCAKTVRFLTSIYGRRRPWWAPRAKSSSATWGFLPISPHASGPKRSCASKPHLLDRGLRRHDRSSRTTASSFGMPEPKKPMAGASPRCRGKKPITSDTEFPQPQEELEAELFRQGQWQGELSHTRRDGRRMVVASRWALQRDKEGKPAAILEINRDITGQKQAEAGRARLAAILEATSDLVGTADLGGRVLYLNRAGRKMLGIGVDGACFRAYG